MDKGFASNFTFDLARVWLEAFNEEDWEKFKAQLHPEITFTQRAIGSVNQTVNEVFTSFHDWRALYASLHGHITDGFGNEHRAVLEVHWTGTKLDGETSDFYACLLFKMQDEKLIEIVDIY